MKQISPAILARLIAFGIVDPSGSTWARRPDVNSASIHSMNWVCQCADERGVRRLVSVRFRPFEAEGKRILVGQCPACRLIVWARWTNASGIFTGDLSPPTTAQAEKGGSPMGNPVGMERHTGSTNSAP